MISSRTPTDQPEGDPIPDGASHLLQTATGRDDLQPILPAASQVSLSVHAYIEELLSKGKENIHVCIDIAHDLARKGDLDRAKTIWQCILESPECTSVMGENYGEFLLTYDYDERMTDENFWQELKERNSTNVNMLSTCALRFAHKNKVRYQPTMWMEILSLRRDEKMVNRCRSAAMTLYRNGYEQAAVLVWEVLTTFVPGVGGSYTGKYVPKKSDPHTLADHSLAQFSETPPIRLKVPVSKLDRAKALLKEENIAEAIQLWFPLAPDEARACVQFAKRLEKQGWAVAHLLWDEITQVNALVVVRTNDEYLKHNANPRMVFRALLTLLPKNGEEKLTKDHSKILEILAVLAGRDPESCGDQYENILQTLQEQKLANRALRNKLNQTRYEYAGKMKQ